MSRLLALRPVTGYQDKSNGALASNCLDLRPTEAPQHAECAPNVSHVSGVGCHRANQVTNRKNIHNSQVPLVCQACEARHGGVCAALTPSQLSRLADFTTKTVHDRDTDLSRLAEQAGTYANILSGVVKLTKTMPDGRQQIVGLQFAPDFMGRPFSREDGLTMEAATPLRLCAFPKAVLEEMLEESPQMERRLHDQALLELDEARDWLLTLGRKSAREKVASFLLLIATHIDPERAESDDPLVLELPLKRADIADFLGLTTETISRQLTHLRKSGIIDIAERRKITIPDLGALRRASETERN